jgi:hypothetical protein
VLALKIGEPDMGDKKTAKRSKKQTKTNNINKEKLKKCFGGIYAANFNDS